MPQTKKKRLLAKPLFPNLR